MKDFKDVYMDIITQMNTDRVSDRLNPDVEIPGTNLYIIDGCVYHKSLSDMYSMVRFVKYKRICACCILQV